MNKLILLTALVSLTACSTDNGMKFTNKGVRGITILNVMKSQRAKAYRAAEIHCAKYSKVPLLLRTTPASDDSIIPTTTRVFECLKPSR